MAIIISIISFVLIFLSDLLKKQIYHESDTQKQNNRTNVIIVLIFRHFQ